MKTSRVLAIAKGRLAKSHGGQTCGMSANQRFICFAIEAAKFAKQITHRDFRRVTRIVDDRLGRSCSLEDWLRREHGIFLKMNSSLDEISEFNDKMQITRHAWIDSMIAEFRALGD